MSTSNSTNYTLLASELIASSFEMIGVAKGGEPLNSEDSATALITLNTMLKAVQQRLNIWKRKTASITLVAEQVTYTFGQKSAGAITSVSAGNLVDSGANFNTDSVIVGDTVLNTTAGTSTTVSAVTSTTQLALTTDILTSADDAYEITDADISAPRPIKILECNRKGTSGNEVTMDALTRNEYENLSNKTSPGTPIQYHYDPTINNGTFYVWLAPDASAVANWTIELVYQATIEDVDSTTDNIDLPPEVIEAVTVGLAYRLSWRFGGLTSTERKSLKQDANEAMDLAEGYDQEDGSIFIYPEIRS